MPPAPLRESASEWQWGRERPPADAFKSVLSTVRWVAHAPIAGPDTGHGVVVDRGLVFPLTRAYLWGLSVTQFVALTWSPSVVSWWVTVVHPSPLRTHVVMKRSTVRAALAQPSLPR